MAAPTVFESNNQTVAAVVGENTAQGDGVFGIGHGVTGRGIVGTSEQQSGVTGISDSGIGVFGESKAVGGSGVLGQNLSAGRGVLGISTAGDAVFGQATLNGRGVVGTSDTHTGVEGNSNSGAGVWGSSKDNEGVHAESHSTVTAAMAAFQLNATSDSAAFYAKHAGNRTAGVFIGNVIVTGDITLSNADCAEDFDVASESVATPGTVMVLDSSGSLRESDRPYDKRVAGVVSGAGSFKAGLVLDKQSETHGRVPVALLGKVFCKVDARFGPIAVGDLLTTSSTPGHAMVAEDPGKAFGSVIGKAMRSVAEGRDLIPILIALQ